jgi:hypothetical protein
MRLVTAHAEAPSVLKRTLEHHRIIDSWCWSVRQAIAFGDERAAYRLTVGFVRRLRELGFFWL